jgi:dipeptidyl aminopeptidase/acylaminoacyl peptidase
VLQYANARAAALFDVSADGREVLVGTRFGSTRQLHVVASPLGMREQITFGDEPVGAARFQPGDPRVVWYLQDRGGGEAYQLFRLDRRTGRAELVTDGKSRHESLVLAHDGRRLAFASSARNGKDTDVYVADAARPREARRVVEAEGTFHPVDFSPDGARLLVVEFRAATDADLHVVDLASGARTRLLPREGKASVREAAFTADGKGVWVVTDRGSDFNLLQRVDLARPDAAPRPFTAAIPWDVEELAVARDGSAVAISVNEDGASRLKLVDPRTGRYRALAAPAGVASRILFPRGGSRRLFFGMTTARSPYDVWSLDLGAGAEATRWTRSEVGGLDTARFVEPELVRYPSKDGVVVPALLYRPPGTFSGRRPVVVLWHGGPEGQHRPELATSIQFLAVELGIAVLLPNPRGSDGYGKRFLGLDDGVLREASLADVGATLDFVAKDERLDPARVAVWGGSYGGYLTLASLAFFPERVKAGVSVVGISSIPTFLETTQPYRRDLRRAEYGDERVPEVRAVQERISPLSAVDRIRPDALLVVQGKNDPRVPQSESEQIVNAVRAKGKEVWYLLGLDEGHGFAKKENRDEMTAVVAWFLARALGVDATAATSP